MTKTIIHCVVCFLLATGFLGSCRSEGKHSVNPLSQVDMSLVYFVKKDQPKPTAEAKLTRVSL
jgi:hypothetical protein